MTSSSPMPPGSGLQQVGLQVRGGTHGGSVARLLDRLHLCGRELHPRHGPGDVLHHGGAVTAQWPGVAGGLLAHVAAPVRSVSRSARSWVTPSRSWLATSRSRATWPWSVVTSLRGAR